VEYDVIIVGAGASGLIAAIAAARQGSSVLVIEQKDKAGKKILATGNGKCNYTNMLQEPECYRSDDSAFAMKVLSCFDVSKTLEFFRELGIYSKERNGYYYPNSEQAASVVSVLLMECERLRVKFRYNEAVIDMKSPDYTVVTESINHDKADKKAGTDKNHKSTGQNQTYQSKKLIIATGGCASPQLGSDGSGYRLAQNYGHTILKPLPALVQLKSPNKYCKTVSGVRTNAVVTAFADQVLVAKEEGEILFTDYGISGIPIMQISRYVSKALDRGQKVYLLLDYLPEISKEELKSLLQNRIQQNPNKSMEEMMVGLFNHKLNYIMINEAKLDPYKKVSLMEPAEIDLLVDQTKEFKMIISDTNSFENAQVCAGGVSTKEIDATSMESQLSNNLYLVGELVDVDGTCGGYNLQWAWSSGYLAGTAAGKKD
jgi:predicted Rossmann fold flavoprotein